MNEKIYKLETKLKEILSDPNPDPASEIRITNQLARELLDIDQLRASRLVQQIQLLLKKCPQAKELAICQTTLTEIQVRKGNFQDALRIGPTTLKLIEQEKLDYLRPFLYSTMGLAHWLQGNLPEGLEFFQQQFEIAQQLGDKSNQAMALTNFGLIHASSDDYTSEYDKYQQALTIYTEIKNKNGQALVLNNIGMNLCSREEHDQGLKSAFEALELAKSTENQNLQLHILDTIGLIYLQLQDYHSAQNYVEQVIELSDVLDMKLHKATALLRMGQLHQLQKKQGKALDYLNQSQLLLEKINNKDELVECHLTLSQIHEQNSNHAKALFHYKQYHKVKERILNEDTYRKIRNLQVTHEVENAAKAYVDNILRSMIDTLIVISPNGRIRTINQATLDLLEYEEQELVGKSANMVIYEEKSAIQDKKVRSTDIEKGFIQGIEKIYLTKSGKKVQMLFSSSTMKDAEGKIQGTVCIAKDITRNKQAEEEQLALKEQLQQSQKMESLGTLASGIAHDFNTLISTIIGYSDIIAKELPKDSVIQDDLLAIGKVGVRAKNLVKQIQDFSRPKSIKKTSFNIVSAVRSSVEFIRKTLPSTIEIQAVYPDDEVIIYANESQINQIILNLCLNARDFMVNGIGILDIKLNIVANFKSAEGIHQGNYLKIQVSDNGKGIDSKLVDRIFDPYFTTKKIGRGNGLGLSVVQRIIYNQKGHIFVESELGTGTTFLIYLPIPEDRRKQTDQNFNT